jgi:hypothetical protein
MIFSRIMLIMFFAYFFSVENSSAKEMEEPKVDYSADFSYEMEAMSFKGKVHASGKKERREIAAGMITITRKDKGVMWQLMPGNMYTEIDLNKSEQKGPMEGKIIEKSEVGQEEIDGHKVTKYKMIMEQEPGKKFGGFFWITRDNIPLKSDMLFKEGEKKHRMTTELKNLKISKVDSKLFEIPAGYSKFSMGGMPAGGPGNKKGMPKGGAGMPDMKEMMKKMQEEMNKANEGSDE